MRKYELIDYFDVWGNTKEGFWVNDQRIVGEIILPDSPSDQDFLDVAIDNGILKYNITLADVIIEEYGEIVEILDPNPRDYIEEEEGKEEEGKEPLPICGFRPLD